jgi:hypothetical protein
MSIFTRRKSLIGALLAALSLGCSAWPSSAQARFAGMHAGGAHVGGIPSGGHATWQDGGRSWHNYGRPYYGRAYDGWYPWGIAGLATGAIVGGAIAQQATPAYGVAADPDWLAYCSQRYRSFDPASGTYLGYDGLRYPCE